MIGLVTLQLKLDENCSKYNWTGDLATEAFEDDWTGDLATKYNCSN
jgi:hypothetical protein